MQGGCIILTSLENVLKGEETVIELLLYGKKELNAVNIGLTPSVQCDCKIYISDLQITIH